MTDFSPESRDAVGWALFRKVKGHQLHSCSGNTSGLWARSPAGPRLGARERLPVMFLSHIGVSLPFSLPSPLSKNK